MGATGLLSFSFPRERSASFATQRYYLQDKGLVDPGYRQDHARLVSRLEGLPRPRLVQRPRGSMTRVQEPGRAHGKEEGTLGRMAGVAYPRSWFQSPRLEQSVPCHRRRCVVASKRASKWTKVCDGRDMYKWGEMMCCTVM